MLRSFFEFLGREIPVKDRFVFFGASALVLLYLLYMIFARRKRNPSQSSEPDL